MTNFPRPRRAPGQGDDSDAQPIDPVLDAELDEALERFLREALVRSADAAPGPQEELRRLRDIDERCRRAWGSALDVTAEVAEIAAAARVRFVQGGQLSRPLEPELVLAVVHAAQHGYRLCAVERGLVGRCWLPVGHDGHCLTRGDVWRWWRALFGGGLPAGAQPRLVCRACTPKSWERAPDNCPHGLRS